MSGGYFDYYQHHITSIAEDVEQLIHSNNDPAVNEWDEPVGRGYSKETIEEFRKAVHYLRIAAIYAQRIDWLVSGDDGEESFHSRLKKELGEEPKKLHLIDGFFTEQQIDEAGCWWWGETGPVYLKPGLFTNPTEAMVLRLELENIRNCPGCYSLSQPKVVEENADGDVKYALFGVRYTYTDEARYEPE